MERLEYSGKLVELERAWRNGDSMERTRRRVSQQIEGVLYPELPAAAEVGHYFLHIPKTAGTSTNRFFESLGLRSRVWLWDQLIDLEASDGPLQSNFLSGHFHMHLEPHLGYKLNRLTMLREPVARTVSHYLHVRRSPEHPYHDLAQSLSLMEFCIHPLTRHMVENYQARYLVDFGIRPRPLGALCTAQDLAGFRLQDLLERLTHGAVADELLLKAAVANLKTFAAVGVTERFPESIGRFAKAMGVAEPSHFDQRHNTAPRHITPSELDLDTQRAIRSATEVDLALYQMVGSW